VSIVNKDSSKKVLLKGGTATYLPFNLSKEIQKDVNILR
jgi:hypothetical protein